MKPLHKPLHVFVFAAALALAASCSKENEGSKVAVDRTSVPVLPAVAYDYSSGKSWANINNDQATLGRVLFYDQALSVNNTVACASCHKQNKGFADELAFSIGYNNKITTRNSMAINNLNPSSQLFWDLREHSLTSMVLKPIQNHIEMGFDQLDNVTKRINSIPYYKALIKKGYGVDELDNKMLADALAQFVMSITSTQSKFDRVGFEGEGILTPLERQGQQLFYNKLPCGRCHNGSDMGGWGMANIGLDMNYKDKGVSTNSPFFFDMRKTNTNENTFNGEGFFKIPSLKNIEFTAPYMHDGRFATLEDVLEHYNNNVQNHKDLDWRFKTKMDDLNGEFKVFNEPIKWNLTKQEKTAVIAFLKTLSDPDILTNVKYSNPFQLQ